MVVVEREHLHVERVRPARQRVVDLVLHGLADDVRTAQDAHALRGGSLERGRAVRGQRPGAGQHQRCPLEAGQAGAGQRVREVGAGGQEGAVQVGLVPVGQQLRGLVAVLTADPRGVLDDRGDLLHDLGVDRRLLADDHHGGGLDLLQCVRRRPRQVVGPGQQDRGLGAGGDRTTGERVRVVLTRGEEDHGGPLRPALGDRRSGAVTGVAVQPLRLVGILGQLLGHTVADHLGTADDDDRGGAELLQGTGSHLRQVVGLGEQHRGSGTAVLTLGPQVVPQRGGAGLCTGVVPGAQRVGILLARGDVDHVCPVRVLGCDGRRCGVAVLAADSVCRDGVRTRGRRLVGLSLRSRGGHGCATGHHRRGSDRGQRSATPPAVGMGHQFAPLRWTPRTGAHGWPHSPLGRRACQRT